MATERRAQSRNRNSAKRAGAAFEIRQAEYLSAALDNEYISRQDKNGGKDLGDIAYVGHERMGVGGKADPENRTPILMEAKNTSSINLTGAMREAHAEAQNYQDKYHTKDPLPVVLHKRHGVAAAAQQWVTMEVETFVRLLRIAEGAE